MPVASYGRRVADYIDNATEQWIGFTFPPVRRTIAEANWETDSPGAYCQRCGDSVAAGEATEAGCATCRAGGELSGGIADGVIRLGPFVESLQLWIHAIKYARWSEMGEELGFRLAQSVRSSDRIDVNRCIVVPMPMPWLRRMYRGIDHSDVVAGALARELRVPKVRILARGNSAPQVSLPASVRKRSGSHGLRVRNRWLWDGWRQIITDARKRQKSKRNKPLRGIHIVLVDDVRTTGATLKAAARLLNRLGPEKIVCAVVAVSDSKARVTRRQQTRAEAPASETRSPVSIAKA
jgi:predicted amidophosphoribosyltransferase